MFRQAQGASRHCSQRGDLDAKGGGEVWVFYGSRAPEGGRQGTEWGY